MSTTLRCLVAAAVLLCAASLHATDFDTSRRAVRSDNAAAAGALTASGADANVGDADRMTPLHWAVLGNQPEAVQQLLDSGADVNARNYMGRTPLHLVAVGDQPASIAALIAHGAAVDATDFQGNTPLHLAARRFKLEAVRALIAAGAPVNAGNNAGQTPLHVLGADSRPDVDDAEFRALLDRIADVLIAAGADPQLVDDDGLTAWPHVTSGGEIRPPSGYPSYDTVAQTLLNRQNSFPNLCQRFDLGATVQGRRIYALKITDNPTVEEDEPEFKYVSTMHGDEVTGLVMCLNLIDHLLNNYGSDPRITNIVNNIEIWIVPTMNPDGYTANTRTNANGVDLNRNFPEGSGPNPEPNTTTGRQPETAAIMNWTFGRSFTLSANLHGGALVVNYPYDNDGMGSVFSPTPDQDLFVYISEEYSRYNPPMWNSATFYHGITNGAAWYAITGGMQDWHYRYMGCNEVTIELGTTKAPPYSQMPTYWNENRDSMLAYMETCLIGVRGIVTDAVTGAPLAATVTVVGRSNKVYTDPDVGDYHRMLLPGTYQIKFEAPGYATVTLPVTVSSGPATRLDVALGGPPQVVSPNGGETLTVGQPTTVSWLGSPSLQYHVQYSNNYGQLGPLTDGFESGSLSSAYTFSGNAPWYVTTGTVYAGTYSARAGAITHSQSSTMMRTAQAGPLSFWYRVSSEANYDWFNFYVGGVLKVHRSGNVNWTYYSETLPAGSHQLKWEYIKDASVSGGSDTVWIDNLTLTGDATAWTDIVALTTPPTLSVPWTPPSTGSDYKVRVRTYFGSGNYSGWDESDGKFTVVPAPNGACCQPDGSCGVTTQAACSGAWQGAGTVCSPNPCPQPTGACCAGNGSCSLTTQAACSGTWQGLGTTCHPNPCAPPICRGDANCDLTISWRDVDYFVTAMNDDQSAWAALFLPGSPACAFANNDVDADGHVSWRDITPFVGLMNTTCP